MRLLSAALGSDVAEGHAGSVLTDEFNTVFQELPPDDERRTLAHIALSMTIIAWALLKMATLEDDEPGVDGPRYRDPHEILRAVDEYREEMLRRGGG